MSFMQARWLVAPLIIALLCSPALAQWKWRDASGRITVSDLPPPRGTAEADILQRPDPNQRRAPVVAPSASAALARPAPVDPELRARREAADKQQQAQLEEQERKLAEQRAENCRNARSHLAAMESGQRLVRMNEKGEREFLDDKQRAAEAQRARAVMQSDCR